MIWLWNSSSPVRAGSPPPSEQEGGRVSPGDCHGDVTCSSCSSVWSCLSCGRPHLRWLPPGRQCRGSSWRTVQFHLHLWESFSLISNTCSPPILQMGCPTDLEMPLALVPPITSVLLHSMETTGLLFHNLWRPWTSFCNPGWASKEAALPDKI